MIGLLAAVERPEYFSHIIMVGPSPCYINENGYKGGFEKSDIEGLIETMEKNYIGWANFLAPKIMGRKDKPELEQELTESFCSTDPVIANQFAKATFFSDNRKDLAKLQTPSLILQCSDDIIAPLEVGDFLHQQLRNSTLRVMKATGHCPHMSEPGETISFSKGNYEEFLTYCTEDTKWIYVGDRTIQGKDKVREYLATAYEESTFRIERVYRGRRKPGSYWLDQVKG